MKVQITQEEYEKLNNTRYAYALLKGYIEAVSDSNCAVLNLDVLNNLLNIVEVAPMRKGERNGRAENHS